MGEIGRLKNWTKLNCTLAQIPSGGGLFNFGFRKAAYQGVAELCVDGTMAVSAQAIPDSLRRRGRGHHLAEGQTLPLAQP